MELAGGTSLARDRSIFIYFWELDRLHSSSVPIAGTGNSLGQTTKTTDYKTDYRIKEGHEQWFLSINTIPRN